MPHQIGFVDNSTMLAHYKMLETIKDFAALNGWTVLRYDTAPENRELILRAPGLSGTEQIFVGLRTYHNVAADYYNLVAAGFSGYVPGNTFDTQPAALLSGVPAHNQYIDYWMTINGQRLCLALKMAPGVYESIYLGKMLPYATPGQYPYPLVVGGMFSGTPATRYSETTHSIPYKGARANMCLLFNSGSWLQPECYPWNNAHLAGATTQTRDTGGGYPLTPIVLSDAQGLYGELDGIYHISGFNNLVENTLVVGGKTHVVIRDVGRTGFNDYYALRLD